MIGLLPAAGRATRLGPLPCSKEIYPVGVPTAAASDAGVRVACSWALEGFAEAGISKIFVILGDGKWDIPTYFDRVGTPGLDLAYLTRPSSPGLPFTLDRAHRHVADQTVALALPDIAFEPASALAELAETLRGREADLALGLFPTTAVTASDMVETDEEGWVRRVRVKQPESGLRHAWALAVWGPRFTALLHRSVTEHVTDTERELHLGQLFQTAVADGLSVRSVTFEQGWFRDLGTLAHLPRLDLSS